MLGTKWPSITSRWIQSAPAASTVAISSFSRLKSADSIEGAIVTERAIDFGPLEHRLRGWAF